MPIVILKATVLLSVCAHIAALGLVISNSTSACLVWLPRDQWYRIEGKQRFNEVFNRHCERDLEQNNPIFIQDTPAYDDVLTNSS